LVEAIVKIKIVVGNFILRKTVINVSSVIRKAILPKIVVTETDRVMINMEAGIMVVVEDIPVLQIAVHVEKEVTTEIGTETIEEERTDKDNTEDLLVDHHDAHQGDHPEKITEAIEETDTDCRSSHDDNSNL